MLLREEVSTVTGTTKKQKKKTPSIETLLDEKNWEEARKRLQRTNSPSRIGVILYHVLANDKTDVPVDILKILFEKLLVNRGRINTYYAYNTFWQEVCNIPKTTFRKKAKTFFEVCQAQSSDSLKEILFACVTYLGNIPSKLAEEFILKLWKQYFPRTDWDFHGWDTLRPDSKHSCDAETGNKLIKYASSPDLLLKSSNDEDPEAQKLKSLWEKTVLLVQATKGVKALKMGDRFPLIRTLIVDDDIHLPKLIFWFAQMMRKNELQVPDGGGRVPLHWAAHYNRRYETLVQRDEQQQGMFLYSCERRKTFQVDIAYGSQLKALTSDSCLVEMLLKTTPEAAKIRDNQGRFPLQLLLDSESDQVDAADYTIRCADKLIKAFPEALLQPDPQSRMLPFMTAAAPSFKSSRYTNSIHLHYGCCKGRLGLIYRILREDPTVVLSGIYSPKELQLMQQLEEAKLQIDKLQKENDNQKKRILELLEGSNGEKNSPSKKTKISV